MAGGWRWVGRVLLGLVVLFLALDAGLKLVGAEVAVTATGELGFSPAATRLLGAVLAAIAILYALPWTRLLGAVLLTGYLGGAIAAQAIHGAPLASHILFGLYLGILAWGAAWLDDPALRRLMPFRRDRAA